MRLLKVAQVWGYGRYDQRKENVYLAVLCPLVLAADLVLLLRREVVLDVEGLADLLGRLAFDHIGDGLAADIE